MKRVVNKLISKGKTISTMESCTGGALANAITNIEGASSVIKFSAVTYSNEFKIKMGVKKEVIDKYSVYSEQTADEMSFNISKFTGSNYGIGITGKLNRVDKNNLYGDNMKEIKVLLISMLNNLIVSSLKIIGGIFCHNNSLMADGFHTFSDFITDIIAIIGTKISKKRANKRYPFGYGNIEYITSIFIGIIIFSLGIFIIIKSIFSTPHETNNMAIVITLIAIILKLLSANYLMKKGTEYHSQILIILKQVLVCKFSFIRGLYRLYHFLCHNV